jgi:hypothetical protein
MSRTNEKLVSALIALGPLAAAALRESPMAPPLNKMIKGAGDRLHHRMHGDVLAQVERAISPKTLNKFLSARSHRSSVNWPMIALAVVGTGVLFGYLTRDQNQTKGSDKGSDKNTGSNTESRSDQDRSDHEPSQKEGRSDDDRGSINGESLGNRPKNSGPNAAGNTTSGF